MNIHTTRIQRITITAPWSEMDAVQAFCDFHGYTVTQRGGMDAPQVEVHAERTIDAERQHMVNPALWTPADERPAHPAPDATQ